jgi:hypothetical protein
MFAVKNSSSTYILYKKTAQIKQSPKRRNFAQSGHPAQYHSHRAANKVDEKIAKTNERKKKHFTAPGPNY